MLIILHAAATTAVEHFRAASNPVDRQLAADLEKMIERTRAEIERLHGILDPRA